MKSEIFLFSQAALKVLLVRRFIKENAKKKDLSKYVGHNRIQKFFRISRQDENPVNKKG